MRRIQGLQYLRAAAALAVIAFHVLEGTSLQVPAGAAGVDVFFVLSGFLMFALTERRPVGVRQFLADRVVRIVPLYWIATLLTFAWAKTSATGIHLVGQGAALLLGSLVFVPRLLAPGPVPVYPTLFVGWTLDYEMFFYVVFAACLPLAPRGRLLALAIVFLALALAGVALPIHDPTLATYTRPIILEFLGGAVIAYLFGRAEAGLLSGRAIVAAVLGLVATLAAFPHDGRHLWGAAAVVLVAGTVALERTGRLPRVPLLGFVGDASYALYLFQIVGFAAADHLLARMSPMLPPPLHVPLFRAAVEFTAALGTGLAAHVAVERPLLRTGRSWMSGLLRAPARMAG